jgi:hypothetical protein
MWFLSLNKKIIYLFFLLLFISVNALAQPEEEFRKFKSLAPKADVILTKYNNRINLTVESDNLVVIYKTKEEILYSGTNVSDFNERSISFSKFYKLKNYSAYTLAVNGNKYKKIPVKEFNESSISNGSVFHDDEVKLNFVLPQIEKGSKSVIESEYEIMEPHMLPVLSVSPYIDYFNVEFSLVYDKNITVAIDTLHMEGLQVNHQITEKGNSIQHSWQFNSPKKYTYENSVPDAEFISPQVIIRVKSYINNGIKVKVLEDLQDLSTWYCSLISKSSENSEIFKKLTDSIVSDCNTEIEKASKIYYWVQKNIRYIAFEDGYAGFIPQKASLVYQDRYGDCKGMANLLFNLLQSQNIDASLCWVGTRDLPYKYTEFPSPIVDNHMIVALKVDSKYLFLDATHPNLIFGVPSPFIQGKEALINNPECTEYFIENVPIVEPEINTLYDSCYISLKNNIVYGEGFVRLTGYTRMEFVDGWRQKNYKFLQKYCREFLLKGNNKFMLDTVWIENEENINQPLYIKYKFKIPDYYILNDQEYYVNLNLEKISMSSKINKERNVPIIFNYKNCEIHIVALDMESFNLENKLPEDVTYNNSFFYFENKYKVSNKQIIRYQKNINNSMMLTTDEFQYFNKLLELMQDSYQKQITLKNEIK